VLHLGRYIYPILGIKRRGKTLAIILKLMMVIFAKEAKLSTLRPKTEQSRERE
jgi:hypothetical protein